MATKYEKKYEYTKFIDKCYNRNKGFSYTRPAPFVHYSNYFAEFLGNYFLKLAKGAG